MPLRSGLAPLARTAALVGLGTLIVHQLRYWLTYGPEADHELAAQGHDYLLQALPALLAMALALLAATLLRAALRRPLPRRFGFRANWLLYSSAIAAVFSLQELAEGVVFSGGHATGFSAVFAFGGWLAFPLAAAAGLICAAADGLLERLERRVADSLPERNRPKRAPDLRVRPEPGWSPQLSPMASGFAVRPPPRFS